MSWNLAVVAILLSGPAANAQTISSADIQEADGSTGQDTASGSGVKTGHIQDDAVTEAKIADGAVNGSHLASGAVQSSHIAMYSNTGVVAPVGGDYTDPSVAMDDYTTWCGTPSLTNPCLLKIMPGVYDIGESQVTMQDYIDIEGSGIGTTRLVGSGTTVVYADGVGGVELRNLTIERIDSTSASYGAGIRLLEFVGELTSIEVSVTSSETGSTGIGIFNGGELVMRRVSVNVSNSASSAYVNGVWINAPVVGRLIDVDISASATGSLSMVRGIVGSGGLRLNDVDVSASGTGAGSKAFGVLWASAAPILEVYDSRVEATGGSWSRGLDVDNVILDRSTVFESSSGTGVANSAGVRTTTSGKIYNSRIASSWASLRADGATDVHGSVLEGRVTGSAFVGNSQIVGGVSSDSVCAGVYNGDYTFFADTCP